MEVIDCVANSRPSRLIRRRRRAKFESFAIAAAAFIALAGCGCASAQQTTAPPALPGTSTTTNAAQSSTKPVLTLPSSPAIVTVNASGVPYELKDAVTVRSTIDIQSEDALYFHLAAPTTGSDTAYITLSACSGPDIIAVATKDGKLTRKQKDDTFLALVVSDDPKNQRPRPQDALDYTPARGGFASERLEQAQQGVSIGVFPPANTYNQTGTLTFEVTASYTGELRKLSPS